MIWWKSATWVPRLFAAAIVFVVSGCGSDGGVGGTGIQSVVQGNVRDFITPAAAGGGGAMRDCHGLTCISVKVSGHDEISDDADEAGNFELVGSFPQVTTLEFYKRLSNQEVLVGSFALLVPAASVVTVKDVQISDDGVHPQEIEVALDDVELRSDPVCTEDPVEAMVFDESGQEFMILIPSEVLSPAYDCADLCVGTTLILDALQEPGGAHMVAVEIKSVLPGLGCLP